MQYDILIKGGLVYDGLGNAPQKADLGIMGERIARIGDLSRDTGKTVIDAAGKCVTPGFIDSHTHSDATIFANPECHSAVRQGVTTEIVGHCGLMRTPLSKDDFDPAGKDIECFYDLGSKYCPEGAMAACLDKLDKMGTSMNTAWFVGHNAMRIAADLYTPDYTEEQFATMERILREALEAGFIGFSTGLEFVPGNVSKPEEVLRLAKIAAQYDANYSSHIRDEGTYLFEAVEEFLDTCRQAGVRGTLSHLNVKYDNGIPNDYLCTCMDKLKKAREEGLQVYTDMLPTCFATGDAIALLPTWLYEESWEKAQQTLADPVGRQKVKDDFCRYWRYLSYGQWDRLLYILPPHMPEIHAVPFAELVKASGKDPFDYFLDVVQSVPSLHDMHCFEMQGIAFNEQTMIDSVVRDPIYLWMTDAYVTTEEGPVAKFTSNIQFYMSMMYFFAHYVRDLGAISLEQALSKVTSRPAEHYKLKDRGVLQEGKFADINVFAMEDLKINATFARLNRYCSGMDYVIVNGTPVIAKGEHTSARAGRVLRKER